MSNGDAGVKLERMKVAWIKMVTKELAEHFAMLPMVDVIEHARFDTDEFIFRVIQPVMGADKVRLYREIPKDWIEAIKDRWLPKWARKYWPVKYDIINVKVSEIYPSLNYPQGHIVVQMSKGLEWRGEDAHGND